MPTPCRSTGAWTSEPPNPPPRAGRRPHELFDLVDPDGPAFTVADWLEAAETQIAATRERGRWPIVVGGTNLYVQNLLYGMDAPAPTDPALRAALDAMSDADLRSKLKQEAPEDADRIHANDRRRTIRALERAAAEGSSPTSAWDGPPREDFVAIGLDWPVESINRRINARVKAMAADGLIDEVRALHDANRLGRQAREALGYREIVDHLEGRCSAKMPSNASRSGPGDLPNNNGPGCVDSEFSPGPFGSTRRGKPPQNWPRRQKNTFFPPTVDLPPQPNRG